MSEQLYPTVIKTKEETQEIINNEINKGLHKERYKEMISQITELERDFIHRRWEKKWNKFDWVFKITVKWGEFGHKI